jgi:hypothetical protein
MPKCFGFPRESRNSGSVFHPKMTWSIRDAWGVLIFRLPPSIDLTSRRLSPASDAILDCVGRFSAARTRVRAACTNALRNNLSDCGESKPSRTKIAAILVSSRPIRSSVSLVALTGNFLMLTSDELEAEGLRISRWRRPHGGHNVMCLRSYSRFAKFGGGKCRRGTKRWCRKVRLTEKSL